MNEAIDDQCTEAFQRFLRTIEHEIDPSSDMYKVMERTFLVGFMEGGQAGVKRFGTAIASDTLKIDDDWME